MQNRLFISLLHISLLALGCSPQAKTPPSLQLIELRFVSAGGATMVFAKDRNDSGKAIKAFKGKWYLYDDFKEISASGDIRYSSTETSYIALSSATSSHHIIQPGEIIYLLDAESSARQEHFAFSEAGGTAYANNVLTQMPPTTKAFSAEITDVIFDDAIPP
jgi:hypothetical protein